MALIFTKPNFTLSPTTTPTTIFKPKHPPQSLSFTKPSTIVRAVISSSSHHSRPEYISHRIDDPTYVRVFDNTLRDGEQSPGATMTAKQKLDIARQLAKLGVDIIEAGFPAASVRDRAAVKTIALEVGNNVDSEGYVPVRCNKNDIDVAWEAVKCAKRPRIHYHTRSQKKKKNNTHWNETNRKWREKVTFL